MFKKPVKIGAQNQLSGKDRKTIRNKLVKQFDADTIETVFGKHDKITCNKVSGSKMLIYIGEDYPLFVDGTGKQDFFPSTYLCHAYQPLAKTITLNEGVESYIFNGANLMWPGVHDISTLGDFQKDQVVSIRNSKGFTVAVGAMGCSFEELKKNADGSGVAVYILHYKGDRLWDMGSKQYPEVIVEAPEVKAQEAPKEQPKVEEAPEPQLKVAQETLKQKPKGKGKKEEKQVKPVQKKQPEPQFESDSDDDLDFGAMIHTKKPAMPQVKVEKKKVAHFSDEEDDKKGKKKGGKKGAQKKKEESQQEQEESVKHKQSEDIEDAPKKGKGKKGKGKKQEQKKKQQSESDEEEPEKEQKSAISSQLMDQYFKQAFLNALKLTKLELPIDSGRFFSDYMVFARTDETQLSIKDSSFKKLGKFYEQMAKQKFIEFKPAKEKKGQQGSTINKIHWENEELKNYVPTVRKLGQKEAEEKEEVFSKEKLVLSKSMGVEVVYKLNKDLQEIFLPKKIVNYMPTEEEEKAMAEKEKEEPKQQFFTEHELKQKIEKYLNTVAVKQKEDKKQGGKERKQDKMVTLSYKDNAFIHKLLKREIEDFEENLEKEEMMAPESDQQEDKKGKKDKHKQHMFRMERGYIVNKMLKLAHPYYQLSDKETGLHKFREGTFRGIQITTDKVMNKNVTKIIGLETFIPANYKEDQIVKQIHGFAHQLQLKFASSATVQNLPGKNAGRQIVIQGHFVDELEGILMQEYGIAKTCITIHNKLGKKKKK